MRTEKECTKLLRWGKQIGAWNLGEGNFHKDTNDRNRNMYDENKCTQHASANVTVTLDLR